MNTLKKILCLLTAIFSFTSFVACDEPKADSPLSNQNPPSTENHQHYFVDGKCSCGKIKDTSSSINYENHFVYTLNEDEKSYSVGFFTIESYAALSKEINDRSAESNEEILACARSLVPVLQATVPLTIPSSYNGLPVTALRDNAFIFSSFDSVTIPDSITTIGFQAFTSCTNLTSVTIPDSVSTIGKWAFNNCYNLTSLTLGSSVTEIGSFAFNSCYKLLEIYNKSTLSITAGSFDFTKIAYYAKAVYTQPYNSKLSTDENGYILYTEKDSVSLIGYTGKEKALSIPEGVTEIYEYALYNCVNLTSVTIPDSVTSIGGLAFYNCTALTEATFISPTDWKCADSNTQKSISSTLLENKETAADYLTNTYCYHTWERSK